MDAKKLARKIQDLADAKKAENIVVMDVGGLNSVTDFFVVATGTSEPHVRAIVDEITVKLRETEGLRPRAIDGQIPTAWMVLDYVDVIVHVMRPEVRAKYDLEGLWGDAPRIKPARRKIARK
jgi:ribosome-associated protein